MSTAGWSTAKAIIAASGTTSAAVELGRQRIVALQTPAALTGTTITFTACLTADGTFLPVYDDAGTAYSVTVSTSRHIYVDERKLWAAPFIKLVSGSSEAAERTITLMTMPLTAD